MDIIIVQGRSCLGKTSLCRELCEKLPESCYMSVDTYKEQLWDECGFDSVEQKEKLSDTAKEIFLTKLVEAIQHKTCKRLFIEYVFHDTFYTKLVNILQSNNITVKTIFLQTANTEEHARAWFERSRNFLLRHPGHNATSYHNGAGDGYYGLSKNEMTIKLPMYGETLFVEVSFTPTYHRSKSLDEIIQFIT